MERFTAVRMKYTWRFAPDIWVLDGISGVHSCCGAMDGISGCPSKEGSGCTVSKAICGRDQRSLGQVQLHSASASEHHGEPAELPDHAGPACTGLPLAGVCAGSGLGYRSYHLLTWVLFW
ncbi:hypothetical protein WJX82_002782 [Trebouxia sp. C0006]